MTYKQKAVNSVAVQFARAAGNDLRSTINDAIRDGVITSNEEASITRGHFALGLALSLAGDDTSLPTQTSPYFSMGPVVFGVGAQQNGANILGYGGYARLGVEIGDLEAVAATLDTAGAIVGTTPESFPDYASWAIPSTPQELIGYLKP